MRTFRRSILSLVLVGMLGCGGAGKMSVDVNTGNASGNQKIINGTPVDQLLSPQIVELDLQFVGGSGLCTGTVIGPTHVLTAGHCITSSLISGSVSTAAGSVPLRAAYRHPGYLESPELGAVFNDVAVVETVAPLNLPALALIASQEPPAESSIGIWGYGLDEDGNLGTLKTGTMTLSWVSPNHLAAVFDNMSNTCQGDSGGPATTALVDENGAVVAVGIVGITSTGSNADCSQGDLSLFTNIQNPAVLSFILGVAPEAVVL